ncbi:MAG: methionyl-tRNA formyltransferase [Deltaproteobacteria bacterium]|nr:methionyl-tRNA formyltransferase [Deltaproteobacteria bacterium]
MKILFFGSDPFAVLPLHTLVESKHSVVAVVTKPDKPAGRGQKETSSPIAIAAQELGLKILKPATLANEIFPTADVLVVVAYGKFLPDELINSVKYKAINIHPSLLPKYRGPSPVETALLNGDKKTGVSITTIVEEMDAGDIYLQVETKIEEDETAEQLFQHLSELGSQLLLKTLDEIEAKGLKPKPQDPNKVIFTKKITKEDGRINWSEPAQTIYNKIRAFTPWPGTYCEWNGKRLKVLEAYIDPTDLPAGRQGTKEKPGTVVETKECLKIACGQGSLILLEVQLEGKNPMPIADFLKGHTLQTATILT